MNTDVYIPIRESWAFCRLSQGSLGHISINFGAKLLAGNGRNSCSSCKFQIPKAPSGGYQDKFNQCLGSSENLTLQPPDRHHPFIGKSKPLALETIIWIKNQKIVDALASNACDRAHNKFHCRTRKQRLTVAFPRLERINGDSRLNACWAFYLDKRSS